MNFVPCLTWVGKGVAKSCPDKLQLTPDELKNIIQETKALSSEIEKGEEAPSDADISDDDENENPTEESKSTLIGKEDDFETRYNLESYDDDGEDQPFMNISDVATFVDNKEDNYITDYDAVEEDDKEDEEDFIIKDSDNLLLVGHIEEESSVLEVYVYNKEEDAMYVHHDIVLPAYPLALEWLDFHPSEETGNYVAVADMTSIVKIWDLDVVDILEPDYCLGKKLKESKMEKLKLKYHTDAVLSLSWNKHLRNILASGSADSSIVIWNLQDGKPLNKLQYHTNKVQSLQWHPFESPFLLSGCTDGCIKLYDCRSAGIAECKSWKVEGEIERVTWNLLDPTKFLCSTDQGFVHSVDMRADKIELSIKAHNDAVTGLDICPMKPFILVTASMDNTMKMWNMETLSHVQTKKLKVGSIYTAKFAPDSELILAIGGNNRSNSLKVLDLKEKLEGSDQVNSNSTSNWKSKNKMGMQNTSKGLKKKIKKKQMSQDGSGQNIENISIKSEPSASCGKTQKTFSQNYLETSEPSTSYCKTEQNIVTHSKKISKLLKNVKPTTHITSYTDIEQLDSNLPKMKKPKKEK